MLIMIAKMKIFTGSGSLLNRLMIRYITVAYILVHIGAVMQ